MAFPEPVNPNWKRGALIFERNVRVDVIAERIGDDPAVLLRNGPAESAGQGKRDFSAQISALATGFRRK